MASELINLKSIKELNDIHNKNVLHNHCVIFISPDEDYLPEVGDAANAGWDIKYAGLTEQGTTNFYLLQTNVKYSIPTGYELQLRLRSSTPKKYNFFLSNSVGTLDSNYRGEVLAGVFPVTTLLELPQPKTRFAQLILSKYYKPGLESKPILHYYNIVNKEEYGNWENIMSTTRGKDGGIVR